MLKKAEKASSVLRGILKKNRIQRGAMIIRGGKERPILDALIWIPAALLIYIWFSWPLAKYSASAVPASSQNQEPGAVLEMLPGDHLQLLYHFELVVEMFHGKVPWFHNPHEFQYGPEVDRPMRRALFMPSSLIYAGLRVVSSPALAWNLCGAIH